ncbi:hypothetical protein ACFWDK_24475 [Micromonospora chalcea]|uniref:hypothetical protein n=1 Tax=Micromonospora sp. TSRI0369 TaxID=1703936 RepID=UPI000B2F1CAE|nr:hypothetical protein [Micromonospora sp. TSRI0369]
MTPTHHVRRQVAEHPQLPSGVRDLLAEDPSANVRVGVFSRRDTPEPIRAPDPYADPAPRMRCPAPRDPDLPVELAERLATDPDSTVRHAVAGHPNLPVHVRRVLLADSSEWVEQAR